MNKLTIALVLIVFAGSMPGARANVTLVDDGQPRSTIFVSADTMAPDRDVAASGFAAEEAETQRRRLRESVNDLALYLGKISKAKIDVVAGPPPAGDKRLPILIGDLAKARFGPPQKSDPGRQGFRVVVSETGLGLYGESDLATSYAIYELLERLGCRWYMPSELGEVVPRLDTIALGELDVSVVPSTRYRGIWYGDDAFKRRIRQGGLLLSMSHALEIRNYITKEQLAAHPDWLGRDVDGKPLGRVRFCWGNDEVADAVADGVIAQIDATGAPTISLSPDDGSTFCECEKCRALDAGDMDPTVGGVSITDRFVHFVNRVAERVTQKRPDTLFGFIAYVQYTRPPVREQLHPSLVPVIAPIGYCRAHSFFQTDCPTRPLIRDIVEGWGKRAENMSGYYFMYNLAEVTVPYPMIRQLSDELPFLFANGVNFWQPETLSNFESALPGLVLASRLSWNAQLRPDEVLEEFYTAFYGAAAAPMRRYWQLFDDAWTSVPDHAGCGFGYPARFTPAFLEQARAAMNDALAACKTDAEKRRVRMHGESLAQFELFMKLRWDLFEGRLASLGDDAARWGEKQSALGKQYEAQSAFTRTTWAPETVGRQYFELFFKAAYEDGQRIAKDFTVMTPVLRQWRYATDPDKQGEARGWQHPDFDDGDWSTTDSCVETWSAIGLNAYFGSVFYRARIDLPAVPSDKKLYLWISGTDGGAKVFVNGKHVPYSGQGGETADEFSGYCQPASFDITSAARPGASNQITIVGTRSTLNEVGTGGLMGPVVFYHEK